MPSRTYKEFIPSHKAPPDPSCKRIGDVPSGERFEVSVYVKPRKDNQEPKAGAGGDPRSGLAARRSALHAHDFRLIEDFAKEHGLSVVCTEPARRLIKLSGTAAQFQTAFQTTLGQYDDG